jgi:hypothetical protein
MQMRLDLIESVKGRRRSYNKPIPYQRFPGPTDRRREQYT